MIKLALGNSLVAPVRFARLGALRASSLQGEFAIALAIITAGAGEQRDRTSATQTKPSAENRFA